MKNTFYLYILLFGLLSISCRNKKSQSLSVEAEQFDNSKSKDTVQLFIEKFLEGQDSLKIKLKYSSTLDTLKLSEVDQRYTFLYITYKDIPIEKLEKSVKEDVWTDVNKEDIQVFELDTVNSVVLYYEASLNKDNKIKGVIDDIVFLKEYNVKGETRMIHHVTSFEKKINTDF